MTASFIPFIIISVLVFVHEMGHFLAAYSCNVELDKIVIYPLGGIAKVDMKVNISLVKELFILIMGPIFQILAYVLLKVILSGYVDMIRIYHYGILFFNLLIIYPLDGGKIFNVLLCFFIPYKTSLKISIIISYLFIILLMIININNICLSVVIMLIFLLYKVGDEYKNIDYLYERFLLERYLYKYNYRKIKIINDINKFYKNKRHLIRWKNEYYWEDEFLRKMYKSY